MSIYISNSFIRSTEMGDFEKILVAIAAAMIVGAVGYAAGCGSWHVISGSEIEISYLCGWIAYQNFCSTQTGRL